MKKTLLLFVCILFACELLFAGGTQENDQTSNIDKTITIQDLTNRSVQIPETVNRIATPNVDAYRILVQLGAQDKLVGIPSNMYGSQFSEKDSIEIRVWPDAKKITKVGGGPPNSEVNLEALIQVNPDIIITWGRKGEEKAAQRADDLQTKTGIPVIALSIYSLGDKLPAIDEAYSLMGKISGQEERAQELLDYFHNEINKTASLINNIPETDHPSIFFGSTRDLVAGSYYPAIEYLALNTVVDKTLYGKEISKEQMIAWNPDIIFLHTPSQAYRPSVDFYYQDPVLQEINAVKNHHVYRYKSFFMGWDIAAGLVDTILIAKRTYPDTFPDVDPAKKGDEILEKFYGESGLFAVLNEQSNLLPDE